MDVDQIIRRHGALTGILKVRAMAGILGIFRFSET